MTKSKKYIKSLIHQKIKQRDIERKIKRLEARRGTGTIRAKLCRKVEINERFQPDEP